MKLSTPVTSVIWNGVEHQVAWKPRPQGGFWVDNWISNMQVCEKPIVSLGMEFASTEQAYQANKFIDPVKRLAIQRAGHPSQAKTMVRKWPVETPNWDTHRLGVMWDICSQKWTQPKHKAILLSHAEPICEFSNWKDSFWAVVIKEDGTVVGGQNYLGRIVESIREQIILGKPLTRPVELQTIQQISLLN